MLGFGDTGMERLADKLGLEFAGRPSDIDFEGETGGLPELPLLDGVEPRFVSGLMWGRLAGANVQIFHLELPDYEPDPKNSQRSCVVITFAAAFPQVLLAPHTAMSRLRASTNWRLFQHLPAEFKDRFDIQSNDPEAAEGILAESLTGWLKHQREDLRFELQGGALLGHVPQIHEDEFPTLIDVVRGFHARIPEEAWGRFNLFSGF